MKQHLTPEDWGTLERTQPKVAQRLRDYYSEYQRKYIAEHYPGQFIDMQSDPIFIWLNIGRLIEFLDEQTYHDEQGEHTWKGNWKMIEPVGEWTVQLFMYKPCEGTDYGFKTVARSKELCDALWSAIKDVLERGDL